MSVLHSQFDQLALSWVVGGARAREWLSVRIPITSVTGRHTHHPSLPSVLKINLVALIHVLTPHNMQLRNTASMACPLRGSDVM